MCSVSFKKVIIIIKKHIFPYLYKILFPLFVEFHKSSRGCKIIDVETL